MSAPEEAGGLAPAYFHQLGRVVVGAANIDSLIAMIFGCLLGPTPNQAAPIYFAAGSAKARLDMVRVSLACADYPAEPKKEISDILERLEKLNTRRNGFVHGLWTYHPDGSARLVSYTPARRQWMVERDVAVREISDLADEYRALHTQALALVTKLNIPQMSLPDHSKNR